jgi:hypothetical protein
MNPTLILAFVLLAASVLARAQVAKEPTQEEFDKAVAEQLRISNLRYATLDAADRSKIPFLKDFLTLYPDTFVQYLKVSGADFPSLSVTTTLHDRYEFRMDIPVKYSDDHLKIVSYGEPQCHLMEVASVSTRDDGAGGIVLESTSGGDLQKHFGINEWEALAESKGDFSVLGFKIEKGKPVPKFEFVIKYLKSRERGKENQ